MSWRERATEVIEEAPQTAVRAKEGWRSRAKPALDTNPERFSTKESALQGFGQGVGFGYLPELQAAGAVAMKPVEKAYEWWTGKEIPDESFDDSLKAFRSRDQAIAKEDPVAHMGGQLAGAVATPGIAFGKGAGLLGTALRGAGAGAATGFLYNPNAEREDASIDFNLPGRVEQAKSGAKMGGLVGGGAKVAEKAVRGLISSPGKLKSAANVLSVKAAGANAGQIKKLYGKKRLNEAGEFLRNEKLIGKGQTVEETLSKTEKMLDETGEKIGNLYGQIQQEVEGAFLKKKLSPEKALKLEKAGLHVNSVLADAEAQLSGFLKGKSGGKQAMAAVQSEIETLNDLATKVDGFGNKVQAEKFEVLDLLKYRRSLDDRINYDRALSDAPVTQQALKKVRDVVQGRINGLIDALDGVAPGERLKTLKTLNKRFQNASDIKELAAGAQGREGAKMTLGLPELIVGGTVGGADAVRSAIDGDPGDAAASLAKGLIAAGAMKTARRFGPGMGAGLLGGTAKAMEKLRVPQVANIAAEGAGHLSKRAPGLLERVK